MVSSFFLLVALFWPSNVGAADDSLNDARREFQMVAAPALAAKCLACHRTEVHKGGLDLSTREGMLKGGESGPGIEPGNPEASPIYARSVSQNGRPPEMPEKGEPLTPQELQALAAWIGAGAPWPENFVLKPASKADGRFWSFQPVVDVSPPLVTDAPRRWNEHPIDRFILARLRERDVTPNDSADARTFIRRATYDLHGLPPTPEEVEEFERAWTTQGDDAAIHQLLDRLLGSPRYGEHWGRHWLDVIRFGESRGYERNEIITNLWPFRDYVIHSFNDDKPFDQFIREHLAGDVVGKDRLEVEIGSAFLVAGPYDDVGNQDAQAAAQIRADQIDEMIRAAGEAFLGLTLGCARCHDHKFDPILAKDYYALYATFAGTTHGAREVATAAAREERTARMQPLQQQRARLAADKDAIENELRQRANARESEAAANWTRPKASRYGTEETFPPVEAKLVRLTVEGTDAEDANQTQFKIDEFEVWTDEETPRNVALAAAGGIAQGSARDARDFSGAYGPALTIDGKFGARWHAAGPELLITLARPERIRRVVFSSDRLRELGEDSPLTPFVGDYRIDVSLDGRTWINVADSSDRAPPSQRRKLARLLKLVTSREDQSRLAALTQQIAQIDNQLAQIPPLPIWWVGNHAPASGPFHVFLGGSPQRRGEEVVPASLRVLAHLPSAYTLPSDSEEGARRLALAQWITAAENPLTPRVLANRVWHYHFGKGIVETPSDFGYMGSRPTHPELLDWLAGELLRNGWKLKPLHRLIMTSQTYRQSSRYRDEAAQVDADSRFLWRFPSRRLAAEELRDSLLEIAGRLDDRQGGPGFRLFDYLQDNVATYVPLDAPGPETYRRAVYHHNARAMRVDLLTDFDCPDPAFAEPRRATTTTPLQALTLMNHRFSLDMAHFLAERLAREASDAAGQVRRGFELAFSRPPDNAELEAAVELINSHGLRAFCRALLNANELMVVP
jgi:hypothetical protein